MEANDAVLGAFLGFLATDITRHPERLQVIDASLVARIQSLTGGPTSEKRPKANP